MEKKRKFLFVSLTGLVGDIAWQVLKEGHEVRYFIGDEEEKDIADGFVPKTDDWEKDVDWADVIVFDDTLGQGEKAVAAAQARERPSSAARPTRTGSRTTARSGRRSSRRPASRSSRTGTSTTSTTRSPTSRRTPTRYVIKPSGAAGNVKRRLFVGDEEDGSDVVRMLEAYKKAFSDEIKVFQLQKRVVGVEVAVGAFFNGKSFVYPINTNFEHKKLFPGNIGPPTGEMGTTMFWSEPNKIFEQTLLKMASRLAEEGYVGYIDVNCIVNNNGIYPLEFTSRFGYPTIFIQQEGMITPIGLFLDDLAHGRDPKLKVKSGFQVGVRIVMPPFPFDDNATFESFSRNAVIVFKRGTPEEVHIEDTKIVEGQWLVAGHVRRRADGRGPRARR